MWRTASAFLSRKSTRRNGAGDWLTRPGVYTDVSRSRERPRKGRKRKEKEEKKRNKLDTVRRGREKKFTRRAVACRQYRMTWRVHWAACRNCRSAASAGRSSREVGLGFSPDKHHPVHVGTEGFRIDRRPGEQPCSDWLSRVARPRRVRGFPQGYDKEDRTSEPSSWLPLVEQQPRARPKRTTDEEGVTSRLEKDGRGRERPRETRRDR